MTPALATAATAPSHADVVPFPHGPASGRAALKQGRRPLGQPLGAILQAMGAVEPGNLLMASAMGARQDVRLGDILVARGWVSEADLMAALSRQWGLPVADLVRDPPDPRLTDRMGVALCVAEAAVPLRRVGGVVVIATARPERFAALRPRLEPLFGPVLMVLAPERDIGAALAAQRQTRLIRAAETRVDAADSCRIRDEARLGRRIVAGLALLAAGLMAAPGVVFALLTLWAVLALVAGTALKAAAFVAEWRASRLPPPPPPPVRLHPRMPVVSVMVPLFHEADIAPRLIERIGRQTYPKELLDILLVVEEGDRTTRDALARARLPHWMRVVPVPDGPLRTKPRALNYALNFCRGSLIGVWDAEDAPAPEQVHDIVRRFDAAPPDVACLQGVLDFYNPRHNWLTRCFTIEYAAWFRAMLPGLARLGLVVPLGGTTLFFRRVILEQIGGWDAHNVTEDADLGLRLARRGYRTELVATVTEEEPNGHPLTWVRQRSRWIKGYAMTWGVHMRDPARLWRELGAWRFWGVQILFLGSLSQAALAPVLWTFWIRAFGVAHPLDRVLPSGAMTVLTGLFIAAEAVSIAVGLWAVRGPGHRHLMTWVPTLHLYFPLAALAAWKALYEVVARPFYWDKTAHGVVEAVSPAAPHPAAMPVAAE